MRLLAVSDLHLAAPSNRRALEQLEQHPDDWLILAGDVGESESQLDGALGLLAERFRQLVWVPGNHDLWTVAENGELRGEAKYRALVEVCRARGVLTPEDPFAPFPCDGRTYLIAPLFLLYDYSFRPEHVLEADAVAWAAETGIVCADEGLLHPDPYPSRSAWCQARCDWTERRLEALEGVLPLVLVNHFPLREDLAATPLIPRFSIWCGTRRTEDWHVRFGASVVVSGHVHIRRTDWRDGVRFEEVSLGYPRQWSQELGMKHYLRQILPAPEGVSEPLPNPVWYR